MRNSLIVLVRSGLKTICYSIDPMPIADHRIRHTVNELIAFSYALRGIGFCALASFNRINWFMCQCRSSSRTCMSWSTSMSIFHIVTTNTPYATAMVSHTYRLLFARPASRHGHILTRRWFSEDTTGQESDQNRFVVVGFLPPATSYRKCCAPCYLRHP